MVLFNDPQSPILARSLNPGKIGAFRSPKEAVKEAVIDGFFWISHTVHKRVDL
jgi:hypothetical protein